jgi:hypothetical protein
MLPGLAEGLLQALREANTWPPRSQTLASSRRRLERFITAEVAGEAALPGTYPPGEELLKRYRASTKRP